MKIWTCQYTDIGSQRKVNQDAILVRLGEYENSDFALLAVADGMGGLDLGEMASGIAIAVLNKWWEEDLATIISGENRIAVMSYELDQKLEEINERIITFASENNGKSGTTLSMILLFDGQYIIKHVGDTRIYSIVGRKLSMITKDDSYHQLQLDKGFTEEEIDEMGIGQNILIKCLGDEKYDRPLTLMGNVNEFDELLICSDGLYNYINHQRLCHYLKKIKHHKKNEIKIQKAISKLVEKQSAPDNFTYIYSRITH